MSPPRKTRFARFSPQGAKKHLGRPGVFLESAWQTRWRGWAQGFAALQPRERILVAAATLLVILAGGYSLWIEPGMRAAERLHNTLTQQAEETSRLNEQVAALAGRDGDPDSARRAALQRLAEEMAATEREIEALGNLLVPPQRVPALLQTLLARHRGLTLVGMTTLPPRPLSAQPAADGTAAPPAARLYEHGIEIRIAGNYQDLLAYVAELDASPHRMLRGGLSLTVRQHPVSELTVRVYTLSLESTWLVV